MNMGTTLQYWRIICVAAMISAAVIPADWHGCSGAVAHAATDIQGHKGQSLPAAPGKTKPVPLQAQLEALAGSAEDIYDLAKANKWIKIGKKLDELKKAEHDLKYDQNEEGSFFSVRLRSAISDLDHAVSLKNRKETMRLANKITLLEAAMLGPLKPAVPTNVRLLDYCGRELEIWSEEKNTDKLSNIVVRMHLLWQSLMPQFSDHGGGAKELRKFSEIMKRLETAKTPEEYGRLARQVLDEMDSIEKVFRR